jgi:hypothetical protein
MEWLKKLFSKEIQTIGFEDVKIALASSEYIFINTLSTTEQECLIAKTVSFDKEEAVINQLLDKGHKESIAIIVYGKHSADTSVLAKRAQLRNLGFGSVYIYGGGLFEWLLLQEIYGTAEFPTMGKCADLLKYRPVPIFQRTFSLRLGL